MKDLESIGRRIAFGGVCGAITGATFGCVDVMRDTNILMRGQASLATKTVFRFSAVFTVFFAGYHGVRKLIRITTPLTSQEAVAMSTVASLAPLGVSASLRPLLPYAAFLIAIDAFNGIDDV